MGDHLFDLFAEKECRVGIGKRVGSRLVWYLRQILPLQYVSTYIEDHTRKVSVWRMWFGRCYNVRTWEVCRGWDVCRHRKIRKLSSDIEGMLKGEECAGGCG